MFPLHAHLRFSFSIGRHDRGYSTSLLAPSELGMDWDDPS